MTPRFIFDGEHLRATALGADGDRLIVSFDHWGEGKSAFPPVKDKSSYVGKGFTHLHLATRRNDWFLNPDTSAALREIAEFAAGFPHRVSLAFSMGGYGALLVSRVVEFGQVLLVSPHSTFSHRHPPFDDRFASDVAEDAFADLASGTIFAGPASKADCVVLYDSTLPFDTEHAEAAGRLFRKARLVDLPGGGHPATRLLTNNRRFGMVMKAITGARIDPAPLARQHRQLAAGRSG